MKPISILDSPEQLDDDITGYVDHEQKVVWIAPHLSRTVREETIAVAVAQAWDEQLKARGVTL